MESSVHAAVPLRVGKKMRKRRELDALVGGGGRGGRLLSASSDEGEPWARRSSRRRKHRPFVRLAAGLALCVCVVSAATVLWLFVDVRRQIVSLRQEMDRVSTSSSSVDDGLQRCHTAAKELRGNASLLSARVAALEEKHNELALKVEAAIQSLATVTKQLADAPSLANTPRRMVELQQTVANFGSQIQGFDIAVEQAHKQSTAATTALEEVKATLQRVEARANQTAANMTERVKLFRELKQRIDDVNGTLVTRIEGLRARIDNNTSPAITSTTTTTAVPPSPVPTIAAEESRPAPPTQSPIKTEVETTVAPTMGPVKPTVTTQ